MSTEPRLRFAPSPTGYLHIGGARTALFNFLHARRFGGKYLVRIEDTDRERSTPEATEAIFDGLKWLGLYPPDEEVIYQSARIERHKEMIAEMLEKGLAYRCTCTPEELDEMRKKAMAEKRKPKYDGRCRDKNHSADLPHVVRFRFPDDGVTAWDDLVQGHISYNNEELDDLIIARTDGSPTYNFTVVVDDHDMGITLVVRGADHTSNTPRQLRLYLALGWQPPQFGHMSLMHAPDGSKISKRHGAVGVTSYRDAGFLPEAINNYLVRIGWSQGDQEIFGMDELTKLFDASEIHSSPGIFDITKNEDGSTKMPEKLLWLNQQHMMATDNEKLVELLMPFLEERNFVIVDDRREQFVQLIDSLKPRWKTLVEMADACKFFFDEKIEPNEKAAKKFLKAKAVEPMKTFLAKYREQDAWSEEDFEKLLKDVCEQYEIKMRDLAQGLRVSTTGVTFSPPLHVVFDALGTARSIERIEAGIKIAEARTEE
jgi:glutamyl-tRNA synthetase